MINENMPPTDWRKPETYEKIRDLDAAGFAWEYLRRNPDYQRAYDDSREAATKFGHRIPSPVRHWGLPCPGRSRAFSWRTIRLLDLISFALCCPVGSCVC